MTELKGTNVAGMVVPFTSDDKYATHDAQYGKGGFRSVATIAERDAIPAERKTDGMIVHVTANGLNYEWKNNAWVEWLPKGNVTVDAALNAGSNNAVSNKAATTGINEAKNAAAAAQNTANAAIPKANIEQTVSQATDKVPSSKAVQTHVSAAASALAGLANNALNTANAAIPKANITQDVEANKTREDLVPSTKAVHDAIDGKIADIPAPVVDAALNATSTNAVQNKVVTAAIADHSGRIVAIEADTTDIRGDLCNVETAVTVNHNAIADINTKLTPIKTAWDKKNAANGLVQLDGSAKLPASVLPAGYDNIDMLVAFLPANPTTGMTIGKKWYNATTKKIFTATSATSGSETVPDGNEKVYINVATNKSYRWTGSDMVVIGDGSGVALGTTASTAFRGDQGNELYRYMNDNVSPQWGSGTFKRKEYLEQAADFYYRIKNVYTTPFILCCNESRDYGFKAVSATADKVTAVLGEFVGASEGSYDQGSPADLEFGAATREKAGIMTAAMFQTLQELELQAFPLTLTLTGAGVFEVGQSVKNPIGISVVRKGANVTSSSVITVTPPSGVTGTLSSTKTIWTPTSNIAANISVSVKADYGAQSQTKSISYTFKRKKYWGVSDKATLTNAEILALAGSGWADSRAMGSTKFDCSGGKYPYYVIPADKYTGLEVWVGGLKNTDLVVTDLQLTNASGATAAYKVIRLTNKQTGVLSIEFK